MSLNHTYLSCKYGKDPELIATYEKIGILQLEYRLIIKVFNYEMEAFEEEWVNYENH